MRYQRDALIQEHIYKGWSRPHIMRRLDVSRRMVDRAMARAPRGILSAAERAAVPVAPYNRRRDGFITGEDAQTIKYMLEVEGLEEWYVRKMFRLSKRGFNRIDLGSVEAFDHGRPGQRPLIKITPEQIKEIRNGGGTLQEVADEYGIDQSYVSRIRSGERCD